jgi:hypothetical protein
MRRTQLECDLPQKAGQPEALVANTLLGCYVKQQIDGEFWLDAWLFVYPGFDYFGNLTFSMGI